MKKMLAIFAVALATLAHAAGYEDWFTPSKGWNGYTVPVNIAIAGASVNREFPVTFSLSDVQYVLEGVTEDVPASAKNAFELSKSALANSIFASCQAMMNKTKIDNLGAALEGVFVSTYGQYVDEAGNVISKSKSGVDTAKLRQQLLANKNAVVSGGQAAGGSEANPLTLVITQKPYDESQFEQHVANGKSLTSLKGWYNLSDTPTTGLDGADGWALAYADYFIPYSVGKSGNLGWLKWNGWDAGCFSAGDDVSGGDNNKPLRLYGWATADNCNESIQNLLTNETATVDRSRHKILTRYDDGSGATIHWVPFDESVIGGGSEQEADDHTIVYTQDADAYIDDPKKFRIKGFDAANTAAASDPKNAKLPIADGSTDLSWKKPVDLFNSSVFDDDANGKVVLKATVTEEGKTEVMTITQNSSGGEVTSQSLEGKTLDYLTDNASLGAVEVSGDDKIGIKSWDRPQDAQASFTLADKLENGTGYVNDPTRSPALVVRNGGTLQYAAIGTLKPLRSDEQSITTNSTNGAVVDGKASIYGYNDADEGTVPKKVSGGIEWVAMSEVDDASVVTNDNGYIAIKGFDAAMDGAAEESGAVLPFVDGNSDELQWGSIMDFFADSVFRQSSETGKILLNGTSEEGKVKVLAMTGTGGDDQTITALTFDNASIDGNPAVGGVVQLHGFDTAPSPYASGGVSFADVLTNTTTQITGMSVPVRVPEQGSPVGYAVKYVPMGKITGIPAAAVDDITIELNETDPQNPYLQLHGAAGDGITLEEGDVYQIGEDGKGKFAKLGADADDEEVASGESASIETYTGEDGGKYFRLRDWMLNREGTPHVLGWNEHKLEYWEATGGGGIEVHESSAGNTLQLANYDTVSDGAIPYAKTDGNGLGWLSGVDNRVPLLHTDGAPTSMAIGNSLDKANVSSVPTLNVAGFTAGGNCSVSLNKMLSDPSETSNRSAHQFMARYSSGGGAPAVHWVSIDDVVSGGTGTPDGYSTSTNETGTVGKMSIKGWNGSSYYPSSYSSTTLASDLASSSTKTYYLVARNNYGSIAYIPVGTMPTTPPRCFQYNTSTHKFENLYFRWGRTEKTATDSFGARTSGTAYLVINHSTGAGVLQASSVSNSDTQTCIKIATVSGGVVTMDYTNMPTIPAYE